MKNMLLLSFGLIQEMSNKKINKETSCCSDSSCCDTSATYVRINPKVGRNNLCPCGSGHKFKKCCGK